eukprot:scaffold7040_cov100-Skeletonema_dohrnii-CCMP3373.AAC.1
MSADKSGAGDSMMMCCCASCGVAEAGDVKLKNCTACYLVKYCSVKCQKDHRPKHKRACKKRAAELRDEILFKQPESTHLGDCPICCIPLPLDLKKSTMMSCCSKVICKGCSHANQKREFEERRDQKCPFCREPTPDTAEECNKQMMKRIEMNDPVALCQEGGVQYMKGNYHSAFDYFTKAAKLGEVEAHCKLARLYHDGHGVEKDKGKEVHHLEEAAIGGHPLARYGLGFYESKNGNRERAVKHWIIAATHGYDLSIKALMDEFRRGFVSKDDLAATLRVHQAVLDATKSPQREAAEEYYRNRNVGVHT